MSGQHVQHLTLLQTDEPVRIVVGERSDRWHRVLNALYAEGIMAGLKDREYRVLHVMMLLRQDDGHAYAPVESIRTLTGYTSSRNIEYALSALLGHPRGLLAAAGRDRYLVLPGWSFAGRDERPAPNGRALERTNVREPTHHRSRITHDRSWPGPAVQELRARFDPEREFVVDDELLAELCRAEPGRKGGAFSASDAAGLIRSADAQTVRTAIRNADALGKSGTLKNWRGYVAKQIRTGCTLFAGLQDQEDNAARNREALARAAEHAGESGPRALAWFDALPVKDRAAMFDARDRAMPPDQLWNRVWSIADARAKRFEAQAAGGARCAVSGDALGIRVSDHAIVQYLELVMGIPRAEMEAAVLPDAMRRALVRAGLQEGEFAAGALHRVAVRDGVVITVKPRADAAEFGVPGTRKKTV